MKKVKILIFATIIFFPVIAFALEVGFPQVGGYTPGPSTGPEDWIRYLYLSSMALVGLALVYTFARAGIERMLGGANPGMIKSSNDRIKNGLFGLLILLGSYVFLREINPQLVNLKTPNIEVNDSGGGLLDFLSLLVRDNSNRNQTGGGYCVNTSQCISGFICKENQCTAVTDASSVVECKSAVSCPSGQDCSCPSGQKCFSGIYGNVLNESVAGSGKCSSLKAKDETCNPTASPPECYGSGSICDALEKKCKSNPVPEI